MQEKELDALQLALGGGVILVQGLLVAQPRENYIIDRPSAEVRLPDPLLQQRAELLTPILQRQRLHLVPVPPIVQCLHCSYSRHTP